MCTFLVNGSKFRLKYSFVILDKRNQSVHNKTFLIEYIFLRQFQISNARRQHVLYVATCPSVYAVSQKVAAKYVFSLQETARRSYFSLHHFRRVSIIIHIMRLAGMGIIEHKGRALLTSGTTYTLQEITRFGRNIRITHHIQITNINTHFQSRSGHKHIG